MTTNRISIVINTLNEATHIVACIESARLLADEIVVCDMQSDDDTTQLAAQAGARVVTCPRADHVGPARRHAVTQATGEWVLVLDADERLTDDLANKLREVVATEAVDVVNVPLLYWYFGGWVRHGGFFVAQARFFRRTTYLDTYKGGDRVHQNFTFLHSAARQLSLPRDYHLLHWAYPTIEKYVNKTMGRYARIEGEDFYKAGTKFSLGRLLGEPLKVFVRSYLLWGGYRDGLRGFILAVLYAGYRFTTWANVWLQEQLAATPTPVKGT